MINKELEEKFYNKRFYFSYSSLNKLMYHPLAFYRWYVLDQKEDRLDSQSMIEGKIIHNLLLDESKFNDTYIISPVNLPEGNNKLVMDKLFQWRHAVINSNPELYKAFEPTGIYDAILEILKEINLHQKLKSDQQRIDKILTEQNNNYYDFLKSKGNRILIDNETYDKCKIAVDVIKNDKSCSDLLRLIPDEFGTDEIFNELLLQIENSGDIKEFGLKGIVDNFTISHVNKTIWINDLKTSSKTLTEFPESIEFWSYWMQAAIYERIIRDQFSHIIDETWKVVFTFVVIDKYNQVYPFKVSESTMKNWQFRLEMKLNEAKYHYENNNYTLPYKFITEQVIL